MVWGEKNTLSHKIDLCSGQKHILAVCKWTAYKIPQIAPSSRFAPHCNFTKRYGNNLCHDFVILPTTKQLMVGLLPLIFVCRGEKCTTKSTYLRIFSFKNKLF